MGKFDISSLRTPQDLERKYNFNSMKKAIELTSRAITKTNNELDNILNSLVISLEDVLDSQSDISLWFYSGTPTTLNEPYIDWIDPTEHYGDLYYDKSTGYVYQYNENKGWELQVDPNLIQALAITNSESDTSSDHERKVYFSTPTVPYSNGDWWIKEDSTLFVCQISKDSTQSYESTDWVGINDYTDSVAEKINDILTVLKGSVTIINDSYAKFTDLATGGSTIIDGANIKTGTINARLVRIENNNVVINENGIEMRNGAKLVSQYGLYSNLQFTSKGTNDNFLFAEMGFIGDYQSGINPSIITFSAYIPSNFVIDEAYLTLYVKPHKIYSYSLGQTGWGYVRNLKLYSCNIDDMIYDQASSYSLKPIPSGTELEVACGTNGYTPETPTDDDYDCNVYTSDDISSVIQQGNNLFMLKSDLPYTADSINGETRDSRDSVGEYLSMKYSGYVFAVLNVYGYVMTENL